MPSEVRYVRIVDIIGDRKRGIPAIIPVSKASWWAGVASGKYPAGKLLGPRTRVWKLEDILELVK